MTGKTEVRGWGGNLIQIPYCPPQIPNRKYLFHDTDKERKVSSEAFDFKETKPYQIPCLSPPFRNN
jgi:hypothetical protein